MAGQAELHGDFHVVNEALRAQPFDRVTALEREKPASGGLLL